MKARTVVLCIATAAVLLQTSNTGAQATNPPYLREMPTVERVKAEIKGTDAIDTAARQAGAFWQLRNVIYKMAISQYRNDRQVTPDEKRLADAYYAAWYSVWQPVQKALAQDRPRLFKLEGYTVDPDVLSEVLERLCSPAFRAEYYKAVGLVETRKQVRREAAQAEQAQAQAEWQQSMKQGQTKRKLARCIASGRSESQCFAAQLEEDIMDSRPAGLTMSGVYSGQGGFSITFAPDGATVACKGVSNIAKYVIQRDGNQLVIRLLQMSPADIVGIGSKLGSELVEKLVPKVSTGNPDEWQGQRVAFPVRADGKLVGSGTLRVTGSVFVGYREEWFPSESRYKTVAVYEPKTVQCPLGILTATAKASPLVGGSVMGTLTRTLGTVFDADEAGGSAKLPEPGLRMSGRYAGPTGFEVEFHPESAVIGCREAVVARDYSVTASGGRVLVNIQNGGTPLALELRPDGALAGAGQVQVNGRVMVGSNQRVDENTRLVTHDPVFQPVSDMCGVDVLTPAQGASAGAGAVAGAGVAPSQPQQPESMTPARPNNASTASAPAPPAANAVLTVTDAFAVPPGTPSPFAGKGITLWKESAENIIRKGGVRPPPGTSALKAWLNACASGQPICQQAAVAVGPLTVTSAKFGPGRQALLPAVLPGTYYVFALTRYNNQTFVWDVRVDLKPGANAATLSQRNTTLVN